MSTNFTGSTSSAGARRAVLLRSVIAIVAAGVTLTSHGQRLPATGRVSVDRAPSSADAPLTPYVRHLGELINQYRARNGLPPLELVPDLSMIASEHSTEMAQEHRLSHDGFRGRFARTDARICVENVGFNFPFPEAQLDGWRASPGHDRNLLEPKVARMGIAASQTFVRFFACS